MIPTQTGEPVKVVDVSQASLEQKIDMFETLHDLLEERVARVETRLQGLIQATHLQTAPIVDDTHSMDDKA
jgi:hypothetical protein